MPRDIRLLNLRFNKISGTFPKSYGIVNATGLESVLLDGNNITGVLPNELSQLSNLAELSLNDNRIEGLPVSWPPHLRSFFIARNLLTGTLPSELVANSNVSVLCNADFSGNNMSQSFDTLNLLPWLRLGVLDISDNNWLGGSMLPLSAEEKRNTNMYITSPVNCSKGTYFNLLPTFPTFLGLGPDLVEYLQLQGPRTPWKFLDPTHSVKVIAETFSFRAGKGGLDVPCSVVCQPTLASFVSEVIEDAGYISSIRLQLGIEDLIFSYRSLLECDCPLYSAETLVSPNFRAIAAFSLDPAEPTADRWNGHATPMEPSPTAIFSFAALPVTLKFGVDYKLKATVLLRLQKTKEGFADTVPLETISNKFQRRLCPSNTDAAVSNTTFCVPCPSEAVCNGTTVIVSPEGWRPSSKELSFVPCRATGCSAATSNRQGWECEEGYEGVLCESCKPNYARSGLFCVECLGKTWATLASAAILVLIVVYLTFFIVLDMRVEESEASTSTGKKHSTKAGMILEALRIEGAEIQPELLNLAKMLGNHLSIMTYVMQKRLAAVNAGLSSVVMYSTQILIPTETYAFFAQLRCLTGFDAIDELFASMPILVALFFIVLVLVAGLSCIPIMKLENPIKKLGAMLCVVLILLGKWVLSSAARIYSCDTLTFKTSDGNVDTEVRTLAADRSITCDDSTRFLSARALAAFLAFFCIVCIPAITLLLFLWHKRQHGATKALQHFRFMTANFLPSSWFWELALLMREYLCELVSLGFSSNLMQLIALRFVIFGALLLQWVRKPYLNKGYNTIDVLSMLCALLLIDLLTITSTLDDSESQLQTVMVIACTSTIVIGVLPFPVRLFRQIRKNRRVRKKRMSEMMMLGSELERMETMVEMLEDPLIEEEMMVPQQQQQQHDHHRETRKEEEKKERKDRDAAGEDQEKKATATTTAPGIAVDALTSTNAVVSNEKKAPAHSPSDVTAAADRRLNDL